MITKKMFVYCCAFNHSLFAQNSFFFFFLTIKATFIQVAFKNIQGLLWKIQGLFKACAKSGLTESEVWRKVFQTTLL